MEHVGRGKFSTSNNLKGAMPTTARSLGMMVPLSMSNDLAVVDMAPVS